MKNSSIFKRYIWLVDTIYSAGSISKQEVFDRWEHASINESGAPMPERMFHRDREAIAEIWGIDIVCDLVTYHYSLSNLGDLGQGTGQAWMADSFAIQNMITHTRDLRDRVIFEHIPAGTRFLSTIASAMTEGHKLCVTYQRFGAAPHSFLLTPYCLKAFKQRWYLVGKPDDRSDETDPRVYALDRILELTLTEEPSTVPESFSASYFFRDYYGIDRREAPVDIRIRVSADAANYLRSLPVHRSQREESRLSDSSIFHFFIAPTYDFIQELRKHGPNVEVLEPQELRRRFAADAQALLDANS